MLSILRQPEEKHRARYISEGSRGAIKDRSGLSFTTVQLVGHDAPATLQVFAATPSGDIRPHPYYKLIKVLGKGVGDTDGENGRLGRGCREVERDGITCLEFQLSPKDKMTAILDCVGILKICSGEVRSLTGMKWAKGSIRLALMVNLPSRKISTLSSPIFCGQQLGKPELKRLIPSTAVMGGEEKAVTLVGRNLDKNTRVHFYKPGPEGESPVWSVEAEIHRDYHTCQFHIICVIPYPELKGPGGRTEVEVEAICGDKVSNPLTFTFLHDVERVGPSIVKQEIIEEPQKKVGITRSTSPPPLLSVFSDLSPQPEPEPVPVSLESRYRTVPYWPFLPPHPASPSSTSPFGGSNLSGSSFSSGTSGIQRLDDKMPLVFIPELLSPSQQLSLETNKRLLLHHQQQASESLRSLDMRHIKIETSQSDRLRDQLTSPYLASMSFESSFGTLSLPTRPAPFGNCTQ